MNVAEETLGFRRASLSLALSLLMSAFALPIPPAAFTSHLHRPTERSPTMCAIPAMHFTMTTRLYVKTLWPRPRYALNFASAKLASSTLGGREMHSSGLHTSLASVPSLSPVTSSAQDDSTSELLR